MTIKWDVSTFELSIIERIASRAAKLALDHGIEYKKGQAVMDLMACHANGRPLNLSALELADDANFGHDVFGIRRHVDRETGKLENCFMPRYSLR